MNKEIEVKLNNVIKAECKHVMEYETDRDVKLEKMETLFNLKKIIDNYDELEPFLIEYFSRKFDRDRWED